MKKLIFALMLLTVFLIAGCSKTDVQVEDNVLTGQVVKQVPSSVVITFEGTPTYANYGSPMLVRWKVQTDIPVDSAETELRYDYVPMVDNDNLDINSYKYHSITYTQSLPRDFESTIYPPKTGIMRIRARVNVNGVDYWTSEKTISIE